MFLKALLRALKNLALQMLLDKASKEILRSVKDQK